MPTANGGKWLRVVDLAIDKGSDDDDDCDDGDGMAVDTRRSFLHSGGSGDRPTE